MATNFNVDISNPSLPKMYEGAGTSPVLAGLSVIGGIASSVIEAKKGIEAAETEEFMAREIQGAEERAVAPLLEPSTDATPEDIAISKASTAVKQGVRPAVTEALEMRRAVSNMRARGVSEVQIMEFMKKHNRTDPEQALLTERTRELEAEEAFKKQITDKIIQIAQPHEMVTLEDGSVDIDATTLNVRKRTEAAAAVDTLLKQFSLEQAQLSNLETQQRIKGIAIENESKARDLRWRQMQPALMQNTTNAVNAYISPIQNELYSELSKPSPDPTKVTELHQKLGQAYTSGLSQVREAGIRNGLSINETNSLISFYKEGFEGLVLTSPTDFNALKAKLNESTIVRENAKNGFAKYNPQASALVNVFPQLSDMVTLQLLENNRSGMISSFNTTDWFNSIAKNAAPNQTNVGATSVDLAKDPIGSDNPDYTNNSFKLAQELNKQTGSEVLNLTTGLNRGEDRGKFLTPLPGANYSIFEVAHRNILNTSDSMSPKDKKKAWDLYSSPQFIKDLQTVEKSRPINGAIIRQGAFNIGLAETRSYAKQITNRPSYGTGNRNLAGNTYRAHVLSVSDDGIISFTGTSPTSGKTRTASAEAGLIERLRAGASTSDIADISYLNKSVQALTELSKSDPMFSRIPEKDRRKVIAGFFTADLDFAAEEFNEYIQMYLSNQEEQE